jgi:hypothetical protein
VGLRIVLCVTVCFNAAVVLGMFKPAHETGHAQGMATTAAAAAAAANPALQFTQKKADSQVRWAMLSTLKKHKNS